MLNSRCPHVKAEQNIWAPSADHVSVTEPSENPTKRVKWSAARHPYGAISFSLRRRDCISRPPIQKHALAWRSDGTADSDPGCAISDSIPTFPVEYLTKKEWCFDLE
ncbi:hypothetical protein XU18_2231 [Perkinsela sp. CCAP 1560/4]|nr:hypothetical protein XU18_2231 [Perkinsela sp. CCAP 1560/4]|eukprot:KNH07030.1 hypothetical protein XU18_2231 [Perkinsela sp. CCAP 1560/4]